METVLVGFLSGVLGVVAAGLLQIRGSRLEQLRDRQIAAADEFGQVAAEVFVTLTARMETLGDPSGREQEWLVRFQEASNEVRKQMHETTRRLPRLEILFGVDSPTAGSAGKVVEGLYRMTAQLKAGAGTLEEVTTNYRSAADAFGRFNKAAHGAVSLPAWRQWVGWSP
jgi:hypothetical protein